MGYTQSSNHSWLHTDQNVTELEHIYDSHHYSIQGIMNLEDSNIMTLDFLLEKVHIYGIRNYLNGIRKLLLITGICLQRMMSNISI